MELCIQLQFHLVLTEALNVVCHSNRKTRIEGRIEGYHINGYKELHLLGYNAISSVES
jgi:hypothetical protein